VKTGYPLAFADQKLKRTSVAPRRRNSARIEQDCSYVQDLLNGVDSNDPRVVPPAALDWLPDVHRWQLQRHAQRD
jgi:hypothetical protein